MTPGRLEAGTFRNPTVLGALALPVMAVLVLGSLQLGMVFLSETWAELSDARPAWELPYLVGWCFGAGATAIGIRLSTTRLAEWYVHFETWFHTRGYRGDGS